MRGGAADYYFLYLKITSCTSNSWQRGRSPTLINNSPNTPGRPPFVRFNSNSRLYFVFTSVVTGLPENKQRKISYQTPVSWYGIPLGPVTFRTKSRGDRGFEQARVRGDARDVSDSRPGGQGSVKIKGTQI